jgi:transcriptional regulator with XRE-family HTH domain
LAGVGARIRDRREKLSLTQDELARRVGISRMYLSRLETDARDGTIATIRAVAKALDLSLDELVGDDPDVLTQPG